MAPHHGKKEVVTFERSSLMTTLPGQEHLAAALTPCPTCGALVITRVWVMAQAKEPGFWRTLDGPVSPIFYTPHVCPEMHLAGTEEVPV